MYIPVNDIEIVLIAIKRMLSKVPGSTEKGRYSIYKKADNRVEVFVESSEEDFQYRVHMSFSKHGVTISPAGNYKKGKFYPIYKSLSKEVFKSTCNYAYQVFRNEVEKHTRTTSISSKQTPGIQQVRAHPVSSYQRKSGIWVMSYKREASQRIII